MSKIIASAAIRGAHAIHDRVAARIDEALQKHGESQEVAFPNTAYYLPIIYAMTGEKVENLGDFAKVMKIAEDLIPPVPAEHMWTPYLGPTLDAGMATLFMEELEEAIKYIDGPNPVDGIWLGSRECSSSPASSCCRTSTSRRRGCTQNWRVECGRTSRFRRRAIPSRGIRSKATSTLASFAT